MAGVLGVPCPGCGLTRATIAMLSGHWRAAAHLHPLVFLLAPLMLWAVSSAALGYVRGPRSSRAHLQANPWLTSRTASAIASVLLLATLAVWGVRFFGYLGGPAPVQTFSAWASAQRSLH